MSEIIFLAILALIVIGPKELPQVARTLGRFLNELKRSTSTFTDDLKQQARIDRIDLYESPKKPTPPSDKEEVQAEHTAHGGSKASNNPQQMEFKIQNDNGEDDNNGNKPT